MNNLSKKIEIIANLGIILVASLLATVLVKDYLIKPVGQSAQDGNQPFDSQKLRPQY